MSPELCRPTYDTRYTFYRSVDRTTMVGARLLRGSSSPPLLYRTGVFRVMAVCVKPQPSAEACLARELLLGRPSHVIEQTIMDFIQLFPHVRKSEAGFLLCHQSVEGIDAAVFGAVSRRSSPIEDERQVFQSFFLPCGDMRKDVSHGPLSRDAWLQHLRVRQTGI